MKTAASAAAPIPGGASNYDELSMQQSLQFADCLNDLKSLKQQLYTAAEHFESSYQKHEQKQIVMTSLKDYALKAFVNTVDHLGSMSYKVNSLLNEKSNELYTIEFPFSCFEQRIQACQKYISLGSFSRQSLFVKTPNHHSRYAFPGPQGISGEPPTSFVRRGRYPAEYASGHSVANEASFTKASPNQASDKRSTSPFRIQLSRCGSLVNRPISPIRFNPLQSKLQKTGTLVAYSLNILRNASINSGFCVRKVRTCSKAIGILVHFQFPLVPRRSASPSSRAEGDRTNDLELYASKSRGMFKALLGMRKSRNGRSSFVIQELG